MIKYFGLCLHWKTSFVVNSNLNVFNFSFVDIAAHFYSFIFIAASLCDSLGSLGSVFFS